MKSMATAIFVILDAIAFSVIAWVTFGYDVWRGQILLILHSDIISRILFLAVSPFPLLFVCRYLQNKYGVALWTIFLCSVLPPLIISLFTGVILIILGLATTGMGDLLVLGGLFMLALVSFGLISCMVAWIYVGQLFENIKRYGARKALSIVLLILCGAAIGNGLNMLLSNYFVSIVISDTSPQIITLNTNSIVKATIIAIIAGVGLAALARYYRNEYSVNFPVFLLCAFVPTFLISGIKAAATYFNDTTHYLHKEEFRDRADNLLFAAAILAMTVTAHAISSAVRRKKSY